MPVYEYTALDDKGKTTSGIIDADGAPAARQRLRSSGIFPVSIKETQEIAEKKAPRTFDLSRFFTRIKPAETAMMTRQLATLISAGFPLVSALDALLPQTKSHGYKRILAKIKNSIVEGNSFAQALSQYPSTFSQLYVNMVRAGETSGTLEIVLDRLADITEKQEDLKNRIQTALAYPIFMCIIGILVLFVLLTYIVPSITSIFTEMNQVLPAPTRILIFLSNFFRLYWWIILGALLAAAVILHRIKKTEKGRYWFAKTTLSLPAFGVLARKLAVARFTRTLGSLLENGVSMLIALEIVKNIAGNQLIAETVENAAKEVSKGQGLGDALSQGRTFPPLSIQMIQVGEQSGELEAMLNKVADVFEKEVETSILRLTSYLEPLMILLMGSIVGFIVLSICLPIFEMNQLIR
ncbi:MAG: type II secretion system inner membrane protein GspF [Desulfobacterales bacterium]|nr:MAG: type II secretion system inner membrane protein GspF [Desulfobacterales bacterium]